MSGKATLWEQEKELVSINKGRILGMRSECLSKLASWPSRSISESKVAKFSLCALCGLQISDERCQM